MTETRLLHDSQDSVCFCIIESFRNFMGNFPKISQGDPLGKSELFLWIVWLCWNLRYVMIACLKSFFEIEHFHLKRKSHVLLCLSSAPMLKHIFSWGYSLQKMKFHSVFLERILNFLKSLSKHSQRENTTNCETLLKIFDLGDASKFVELIIYSKNHSKSMNFPQNCFFCGQLN